jgi:ribonucleoside-diphosphate reductase beta chain
MLKTGKNLHPKEKNLLTQIFRLFTQSDVDVGAGYVDRYMRIFGKNLKLE